MTVNKTNGNSNKRTRRRVANPGDNISHKKSAQRGTAHISIDKRICLLYTSRCVYETGTEVSEAHNTVHRTPSTPDYTRPGLSGRATRRQERQTTFVPRSCKTSAREKLLKHFEVKNLKGFGVEHLKNGIIASGAILQYLIMTQHSASSSCAVPSANPFNAA